MKDVFLFGAVTAKLLAEKVSTILIDKNKSYQLIDVLFYGEKFAVYTTDDVRKTQVFVTVDSLSVTQSRINTVQEYIENEDGVSRSIMALLGKELELKLLFLGSHGDKSKVCASQDDFALYYGETMLQEKDKPVNVVEVKFAVDNAEKAFAAKAG